MLIVPPVMFYNKTYTELTCVLHLGKNICGHDGIIHGGLAATLLDEGLACVVSFFIFIFFLQCIWKLILTSHYC
jgi:hypothetical protein